jgi:SAM-dependent methyltransferase
VSESSAAPGTRSNCWRDIDTADPGFFVQYLDRAAASLAEARRDAISVLDMQSGCRVLDVGCGLGDFLIEVTTSIQGMTGVGIDASEALIGAARARVLDARAPVELAVGDAERLTFGGATFDRIHCSRVLVHLQRPEVAVTEMARVLVPGGRAVLWEPDFDALMIDSDDVTIARAVRDELIAGIANPDIGRRLRRLVLDAGLEPVDVASRVVAVESLQHAVDSFHLFEHLDAAVATGTVSAVDAAQWRTWIESAAASDRCFIAPIAFRITARKPA